MSQIIDFINSAPIKAFVADFILSSGVALGGVVIGTWGEATASAGVVSFIVARTLILAIGKGVLKWATS